MNKMVKFRAKCPIKGCDFVKESNWKNTARGGIVAHIYREDGDGHGLQGSRPDSEYDILVERIEDG